MNEKKKTPASRGTLAGEKGREGSTIPNFDYTRGTEGKQVAIASLLGHGQSEATTTATLMDWTGYSRRDITKRIEAERRNGIPILSNGNGYFLPADDDEVKSCVLSLRNRANEIRLTAKAIEKGAGLYG